MNDQHDQAELWMRSLASQQQDEMPLPDPQLIWWRAQSMRRIDQERQAITALDRAERIPLFASLAATMTLVVCLAIIYLGHEFNLTLLSAIACTSGLFVVLTCWRLSKSVERQCAAQVDRT